METIIRFDLAETLRNQDPVILELGAGKENVQNRILIDQLDMPHIDIVTDLETGLPLFPDNSVDQIYSTSLLEHIDNLDGLMRDIWRVLKPTGEISLFVPHFSNPYFYSDYTHKRFFGLYSFEYFAHDQTRFKRKVPSFYHDFGFMVKDITLIFFSPWKERTIGKRIFQKFINSNTALMEYYEENLCYFVPCYGIDVTLQPVKDVT